MSSRVHIFVSRRARDEAVDRIMASFLEAHRLRPVDDRNRTAIGSPRPRYHWLCR